MKTQLENNNNANLTEHENPVIQIRELYKSFGSNHVIKNFNLEIQQGQNIVVLGKSGSGKSVLIKCIIGLIKPNAGSIRVFGEEVTKMSRTALDQMRAQVGFLFQSNALYDSMTVRENLEFPLRRHHKNNSKEEVDFLVREALQNVGLEHTLEMRPAELSGGMRKRIALARTLILKPKIILYDEPTTGLDPITGKEISNLMVTLAKKYNTTSIIISHDLSCVKIVASEIVMLIDGQCYAKGTFEELKNSTDIKIKTFFE